jgi:uncharacterized damage-inducible protein DinB
LNYAKQIAKQFREVHFGGNWTAINLKDALNELTWQQATTKIYSFNTIAELVFHMNYYVSAALQVLNGKALNAHDKYSFNLPPIHSKEDWERLLDKTQIDAENFITFVDQLPENKLIEIFADEKYGTYYRNLHGVIEHIHSHLEQIILIKKIILQAREINS